MTITYWFFQWYHKNYYLNKYNIGMTKHDDRLWLLLVDLFFLLSHYAFVSQETLSNQLCSGRLTAKSVIDLDMRWDYLHVTVRTTKIKRTGWVETKSKHLACNSIFVFEFKTCFRSFCFATRCYDWLIRLSLAGHVHFDSHVKWL